MADSILVSSEFVDAGLLSPGSSSGAALVGAGLSPDLSAGASATVRLTQVFAEVLRSDKDSPTARFTQQFTEVLRSDSDAAAVPTFVNAGTVGNNSGLNLTVPLPASLVVGNLLLCLVYTSASFAGQMAWTVPTGWTPISYAPGANMGALVCYRVIDGTETAPVFVSSYNQVCSGVIYQFNGALATSAAIGAISEKDTQDASTGSISVNPIKTTSANSLVFAFRRTFGTVTSSVPAGWTSLNAFAWTAVVAVTDADSAPPDWSETLSASGDWTTIEIEIRANAPVAPEAVIVPSGMAYGIAAGGSVASVTAALTTGSSYNIIVVLIHNNSGSYRSVSSVTDIAGLTWKKRKLLHWNDSETYSGFNTYEIWWSYSHDTLVVDTITVNLGGTSDYTNLSVLAFPVKNVNPARYASPWDHPPSLPKAANDISGATTTPNVTGVETASDNTLLLGAFFAGHAATTIPSAPAGFNKIGTLSNTANTLSFSKQGLWYETITTRQSGLAVAAVGDTLDWGFVVDALAGVSVTAEPHYPSPHPAVTRRVIAALAGF